jgi:hypothetical protein
MATRRKRDAATIRTAGEGDALETLPSPTIAALAPVAEVQVAAESDRIAEVEGLGRRVWVLSDCLIPSQAGQAGVDCREGACILNTCEQIAVIELTLYFNDRDPVGPYRLEVEPSRTRQLEFASLDSPLPVPRDVCFAAVFRVGIPVVVSHFRLDTRPPPRAVVAAPGWSE